MATAEARRNERIDAIARVFACNSDGFSPSPTYTSPSADPMMDDPLAGAVKKALELCKKLSNEAVYMLGRCCTYPVFVRGVSHVTTFIPQFDAIVRDPYAKEHFGEHLQSILKVRDIIMGVIVDTLKTGKLNESHVGPATWRLYQEGGAEALSSARHDLWLWAWWQLHLNLTYVPAHSIRRHFVDSSADSPAVATAALTWDGALRHLVYAPANGTSSRDNTILTHKSVRECEVQIDELFDEARVVVPDSLVSRTDAGSLPGLDEPQTRVVNAALRSPVFMLQGGAGVGKTTTMAVLVSQVAEACCDASVASPSPSSFFGSGHGINNAGRFQVVCLAFTHKAKRCLSERLFKHAPLVKFIDSGVVRVSTIHSFIQTVRSRTASASSSLAGGGMGGGGDAAVGDTFIVLDESSMVDIELMAELGRALRQAGIAYQLCMVGDEDQLAPVGRGEVFRALVNVRRSRPDAFDNFAVLTHCYRTDRPDLFDAYSAIREGRTPRSSQHFQLTLTQSDAVTYSTVQGLIAAMPGGPDALPLFITWQNRDVNRINGWVQEALLRGKFVGPNKVADFYKGDRVMYVGENESESGGGGALTNATMGRVVEARGLELVIEWDTESGPVRRVHKTGPGSNSNSSARRGRAHPGQHQGSAAAGGRSATLSIKDIRLAYCLTVHKGQGSEYDHVVVVCFEVPKMCKCLDRRWLYTAASRGKRQVQVIGTKSLTKFIEADLKPHEPLFLRALEPQQQ